MQMPPQNMVVPPQFAGVTRTFGAPNVYSVIEGSPTYKQRRRRSSLSTGITAAINAAANNNNGSQPHRPSDLRRSMSASVQPVPEADESQQNSPQHSVVGHGAYPQQQQQTQHEYSRHGTPLTTVEQSPVPESAQQLTISQEELHGLNGVASAAVVNDYGAESGQAVAAAHNAALARTAAGQQPANGVFRRARSATMMELGPYPQKSHSCPIPTCGRLFKRLEHLKRFVSLPSAVPVSDSVLVGLSSCVERGRGPPRTIPCPGLKPTGMYRLQNMLTRSPQARAHAHPGAALCMHPVRKGVFPV
jgi:transcription factor STE12